MACSSREAGRRAPAFRHAGCGHRREHALGDGTGSVGQLRAAVHIRGVRRAGSFTDSVPLPCSRFAARSPTRRAPSARRAIRSTPLLFVVAAAAIVANTIATQPGRAAVGIGVVLWAFLCISSGLSVLRGAGRLGHGGFKRSGLQSTVIVLRTRAGAARSPCMVRDRRPGGVRGNRCRTRLVGKAASSGRETSGRGAGADACQTT